MDLYAEPLGASVEEATHFVPRFGGAPANVALVLGRLGHPVRFVGAIGRDGFGTRIARSLAAEGVDTQALLRVPERTGITFVRRTVEGERSFLFYRSLGADAALSVEALAGLSPAAHDGARWVVLGTSALINPSMAEAVRYLVRGAVANGARVFVDLNARPHLWGGARDLRSAALELCAVASVVKASEEDCTALGVAPSLEALATLAPNSAVVLTLAERGAVARVEGVELRANAVPVEAVIDATGAGDAFVAGILAAIHSATDLERWERGLSAGCSLGAMACAGCGATDAVIPPWPEDVASVALPRGPWAEYKLTRDE